MNDTTKTAFLPFARPSIGEEEIAEVARCLRSGWVTTGPMTRRFESEFAARIGARHALAVNSATAGLHLALEAIGVGPGDRVAVPVHTFTASAEVIRYLGADPLFVDVKADTLDLDPRRLEEALAAAGPVKAVMPVHFAGQACDMEAIEAIARRHGTLLVEDAAHSFPATSGGRLVGTIGKATVFSFYATKTITTGEGGMVVTDDDALAARVKVMRLHGISRDVFDRYTSDKPSWFYEVIAPGFKYNMTDVAAALGVHQLKRADEFRARREAIAKAYDAGLRGLPVDLPAVRRPADLHAWHLYVLRLRLESLALTRDEFIARLAQAGIGTSVHFIPLHLQPYWRDRYALRPEQFPVASEQFPRIVSLPIYPAMTDGDVARVIAAIRALLERA
jgi:dTDP-4-amino-4,6-dideoxygalactose transaminase